jgi:hypothetical protein
MPFNLPANFNPGDSYTNVHANNVAAAINTIVNGLRSAFVSTSEAYATAAWGDCATTTDQVTVTIGQSGVALVFISASIAPSAAGVAGYLSIAASGANTIAAGNVPNIMYQAPGASYGGLYGNMAPLQGLSPGSTTFKLKYYVVGGSANFSTRFITVIPFP